MNKKINIVILISLVIFIAFSFDVSAQCAMCRSTAESNLKGGGAVGKGLNFGILYLMAIPYIILMLIFRKQIGTLLKMLKAKYFPAKRAN